MYRAQVGGGIDASAQFERRLGPVLKLDQQQVTPMEYSTTGNRYEPMYAAARRNSYSTMTRTAGASAIAPAPSAHSRVKDHCVELALN